MRTDPKQLRYAQKGPWTAPNFLKGLQATLKNGSQTNTLQMDTAHVWTCTALHTHSHPRRSFLYTTASTQGMDMNVGWRESALCRVDPRGVVAGLGCGLPLGRLIAESASHAPTAASTGA